MCKVIALRHETDPIVGVRKTMKNDMLCVPSKVLDWDKAVDIIVGKDISNAHVGLAEDFFHTQGQATRDYVPVPVGHNMTFGVCLASKWATPCVYDEMNDIAYECYYEIPSDEKVVDLMKVWWPEESLKKYKEMRE